MHKYHIDLDQNITTGVGRIDRSKTAAAADFHMIYVRIYAVNNMSTSARILYYNIYVLNCVHIQKFSIVIGIMSAMRHCHAFPIIRCAHMRQNNGGMRSSGQLRLNGQLLVQHMMNIYNLL